MSAAAEAGRAALEKRLRMASLLTCLGLLVLILTLIRIHPLAFVVFAVIGCPLAAAGILLFLYSVVSEPQLN